MRMNRGTVTLLVVSLVVIVAVLALTIYRAAAPGDEEEVISGQEADADATEIALFPGIDTGSVLRLEVRDNRTGQRTVLIKNDDTSWGVGNPDGIGPEQELTGFVEEATAEPAQVRATNYDVDEAHVQTLLGEFFQLASMESFEADDLAQFGLDEPAYSVFAVADSGEIYVLYIGDRNPAGTRYYGVVEQIAPGETSPNVPAMQVDLNRAEDRTTADDVVVPGDIPGTPEVMAGAAFAMELQGTLAAMPTDDPARADIAATYSAVIDAQNAAAATATAMAADRARTQGAGGQAGAAATQPVQAQADETQMAVAQDVVRAEIDTSQDPNATPVVATAEATGVAMPDSALMEVTVEPVEQPTVRLQGPQRVYLLPTRSIDAMIAIITAPPVVPVVEGIETPVVPTLMVEQPDVLSTEAPAGAQTAEPTAEATPAS